MNDHGIFISVDGPGGTGKSTTVAMVGSKLTSLGYRVHTTTEPSPTPLGRLIRASTDIYKGITLACLVAGDRHHHLTAEIRPQLDAGAIVISDRYLPSSLVLQRMDDVSWDMIMLLNSGIDMPDLAVVINAESSLLASRLASRGGTNSRFERLPGSSATEHGLYQDTATRLTAMGWPICEIDNSAHTPGETAAIVTDHILTLIADRERSC